MPPYKILSIVSFVYAVYLIIGYRKSTLPYYYYFIIWTCLSETVISPWCKDTFNSNSAFYSIYSFTCVFYYGFVFFRRNKTLYSQYYLLSFLILIILFGCELYYKYEKNGVTNYSYVIGLTLIVIVIIKKMNVLISKDVSYFSFTEIPLFIFSTGILVFYFTSFPLLFFFDFLVQHNQAFRAYDTLLKTGNLILHLGYLLTLIWFTKIPPSTTSS